jgi:hypothetical protein
MSCHNDEGRVENSALEVGWIDCAQKIHHMKITNHMSVDQFWLKIWKWKFWTKNVLQPESWVSMVHFILQRRLQPHTSTKNIQKPKAMQNGKQRIRRGAILSLCLYDYFSYPSWVRRVGLFCPLLVFEPP